MTNSTFAAKAAAEFADNLADVSSAFADYIELEALMDPNAKGNMPWDVDLHYFINNTLNGLWSAMYGNTTDSRPNVDNDQDKVGKDLFWKPVNQKARADSALAKYIEKKPYADESSDRFDAEQAANDTDFIRISTRAESRANLFSLYQTMFNSYNALYERLFDETWTYKPYKAGEAKAGKEPTEADKKAAELYRQRMAKRNAA